MPQIFAKNNNISHQPIDIGLFMVYFIISKKKLETNLKTLQSNNLKILENFNIATKISCVIYAEDKRLISFYHSDKN